MFCIRMHICNYIYINLHIYIYICLCIYIYVYTYMYVFKYIHVYLYIYMCIHMYIYTNIYMYTYSVGMRKRSTAQTKETWRVAKEPCYWHNRAKEACWNANKAIYRHTKACTDTKGSYLSHEKEPCWDQHKRALFVAQKSLICRTRKSPVGMQKSTDTKEPYSSHKRALFVAKEPYLCHICRTKKPCYKRALFVTQKSSIRRIALTKKSHTTKEPYLPHKRALFVACRILICILVHMAELEDCVVSCVCLVRVTWRIHTCDMTHS